MHHYKCEQLQQQSQKCKCNVGKRKQGKIVIAFIWQCYCLAARVVSLACDKKRGQYRTRRLLFPVTKNPNEQRLSISFILFPSPSSIRSEGKSWRKKTKKNNFLPKILCNLWTFFLFSSSKKQEKIIFKLEILKWTDAQHYVKYSLFFLLYTCDDVVRCFVDYEDDS